MPPVCKLCSASDVGRACAAQCHPARVAAGMRAGALRPSGSVWLATPGRDERDYPDADSCPRRMSRTHARTGGRRANGAARLPLCRSASRFKLAWQSSAFLEADGRSAYHRTQTVAAACNPLGDTPIVSHGRKEGTVAVPTHASDVGWFPQSPPPFPPVALDRAFCRARRRRDPCNPMSLVWRCCELARHSQVCIRDSSTQAWARVCGTSPVVRQSWQAQKRTIPRSLQC